uniref:Uncharacterized protein n=1 Tax=Chenopodium quinoa TaxID=63459 RepID=A0A803MN66_CHEQI
KAAVEKAMQEAQNILANNDAVKDEQYQLVAVGGVMQNSQTRPIRLMKTHEVKGKFVTNPPKTIGGEAPGAFVHQGATSQGQLQVIVGSKCAIVYGTIDRAFPGLGYLLAWDKPDNSDEINKVYVEAGDLTSWRKWSGVKSNQN